MTGGRVSGEGPTALRKAWKSSRRSALLISTLVSSFAGFLFGYDNIVISGAIGHLAAYFHLTPGVVGWAAGCALVGCLLGSSSSGVVADRFGLKKALYACAACFALSSLGLFLASSFSIFVAWRILGGLGIGAASIVAPMYIAEIAPAAVRGRLVVFYQFGIVAGILAAVFVNMLIERAGSNAWEVEHGWHWMFAAGVVPAFAFGAAILLSHESPRWLMKVGREREGERVLIDINGEDQAKAEAASIRNSLAEEHGGFSELWEQPFRRALLIGCVLAAFSQASGITSLLSFLPEVFKNAGQNSADAFFQSVLVGCINLLFTAIAIWLVDKAGRRTLLLFGTALQALALLTLGYLYGHRGHSIGILAGIMAFVGGHAVGNGAVCWVVISEIFPNRVRGVAMSIATTALWISAYLANQFFPTMLNAFGSSGTFLFFSLIAALNFTFVFAAVPETSGYSLEEISNFWTQRDRKRA